MSVFYYSTLRLVSYLRTNCAVFSRTKFVDLNPTDITNLADFIHKLRLRITKLEISQAFSTFFSYNNHARIIVSSILNFVLAFTTCGALAGMMIASPVLKEYGWPEIRISASPSRR